MEPLGRKFRTAAMTMMDVVQRDCADQIKQGEVPSAGRGDLEYVRTMALAEIAEALAEIAGDGILTWPRGNTGARQL